MRLTVFFWIFVIVAPATVVAGKTKSEKAKEGLAKAKTNFEEELAKKKAEYLKNVAKLEEKYNEKVEKSWMTTRL